MIYHSPRIFRPKGSIGTFGVNTPEEVKTLQKMMINAGYNHIYGNHLRATGNCDPETNSAIIWYQRLLNMSPSGLVHPQQTWFFSMFSKAMAPHWRPRDIGPLHVRMGQITFDAEGVDYLTAVEPFRQPENMPHFSRILYWPGKNSGVTLGRGYDMKKRSPGQILTELRQGGIEEYKAVICSKASGLVGLKAVMNFIKGYGPLVGEISHLQQVRLFEIAYREKCEFAKGVYSRQSKSIANPISWSALDSRIKEVFVDTIYQGNKSAPKMVQIMAKGGSRSDIIEYLNNDPYHGENERDNTRRLYLR
ncbi:MULTISPECIES: peptidoglycan-binding protein [Pseudescherichia]|uniref:peptidoglycan-binding protein n=1 Tax=Pseudescherichia TaxID=2055880 RepID=UPI00301E4326